MTGLYRRAGVAVEKPALRSAIPLHRSANAVAIAEVDVVTHSDFIAVVEDRRAGKRKQQAVQQFDAAAIVIDQRGEAPANTQVDAHPGVRAVSEVHIVPLVVGHHFQRQLIVVSEK